MPEEPRLADDIDPNKLLVEIVQGLLMAHARLDHMEQALCKAVESASWKHLCSFDERLSTVDLRFKRTTADADKAVASLGEVRDDLVRSVQAVSIQHYDVFKSEVASIQASVDHLRTEGVLRLAADMKANRLAEQHHFDDLQIRLKSLTSNDGEQKSFGLAESTKQSGNWKSLFEFLQGIKAASFTSAADLKKQINDGTKFLSHENETLSEHFKAAVKLINTSDAKHNIEMRRVRILLYWLISFSVFLVGLLAATTYSLWMPIVKLWIR